MGLAQDSLDYEAACRAGKVREWLAGEWSPSREPWPTDPSTREGLSDYEWMRLRGD